MNLGRFTFTAAQTGLVIRELYQNSGAMLTNGEWFILYVKDGTEYGDVISFPAGGDQTLLNTALTSGQYYTFTLTPGATVNDEAVGSSVALN